eukprot:COSAG05_NODE_19413_length_293_cov_0.793814_1_plen_78_part_10
MGYDTAATTLEAAFGQGVIHYYVSWRLEQVEPSILVALRILRAQVRRRGARPQSPGLACTPPHDFCTASVAVVGFMIR